MRTIRGHLRAATTVILAAGMALVLLLGRTTTARGAPGDLDGSFNGTGMVLTQLSASSAIHSIASLNNGDILAIGSSLNPQNPQSSHFQFALARYTSDGALDPTFGAGGIVTTSLGVGDAVANTYLFTRDGRIVAGGRFSTQPDGSDSTFALVRYSPNGVIDPTFGNNGVVDPPIGLPDARIYLLGATSNGDYLAIGSTTANGVTMLATAEYTPDGALDPNYGSGGISVDSNVSGFPIGALVDDNDGFEVDSVTGNTSSVTRYNANGSVDPTFGINGQSTLVLSPALDQINRIRTLAGGRILVAGVLGGQFALARYYGDGTLDPTFGSGGVQVTDFGTGSGAAWSMVTDDQGRIVAGGESASMFALARYDGTLTPVTGTLGPAAGLHAITVQADDAAAQSAVVPVQQDLIAAFTTLNTDYGLTPNRPLTIYLTSNAMSERARLKSDFGYTDQEVTNLGSNTTSVHGATLATAVLLFYLPNVDDMSAAVAQAAAGYTLQTIGGGIDQVDAYPQWFLHGFDNYLWTRFQSSTDNGWFDQAVKDAQAGTAPSLSSIATLDGTTAFTNNDRTLSYTFNARAEAAVQFLAQRFGEAALGTLIYEDAFGSIDQFNSILQQITGMTIDQFDAALNAALVGAGPTTPAPMTAAPATSTPAPTSAALATAGAALPQGASVVAADSASQARVAEAQQDLAAILASFRNDYGLVPADPLTVHLVTDQATAMSLLESSTFAYQPSDAASFFSNMQITALGGDMNGADILIYLPNADDLRGRLAFRTALYALVSVGKDATHYPYWFVRGWELYQEARFSASPIGFTTRAESDAQQGTGPTLASIATSSDVQSFLAGGTQASLTLDARSEAAVALLARRFGEASLGQLIMQNANGSIGQFNMILQQITGMTIDQFNTALDAYLKQQPAPSPAATNLLLHQDRDQFTNSWRPVGR